MAAALAAFYQRIPVAHVEAGLRTYDKYSPYPEEIDWQRSADLQIYIFAPTSGSRDNLLREGVAAEAIQVTGNTAIDALPRTIARLDGRDECRAVVGTSFDTSALRGKRLFVAHRE